MLNNLIFDKWRRGKVSDGSFALGEYTCPLCLMSKLLDLRGRYANPYSRGLCLAYMFDFRRASVCTVDPTGVWFVTRASLLTSEFCEAKHRRTPPSAAVRLR